ncbi:uncharacterized protein METZ01_LOCUS517388, partial [marine metagenome]
MTFKTWFHSSKGISSKLHFGNTANRAALFIFVTGYHPNYET